MNPLSAIYYSVVAAKNLAYDHGLLKPRKLSWPVVSVGNLSVGGSGKTPFVILLGQLLRRQGFFVTVLSRGYRRDATAVELVDPDGEPARYGDEPLLIAHRLQAPVFVGAERYQCGLLAESKFAEYRTGKHPLRAVHILDDGFQHRRLARTFDIVLVPPEDLDGSLLPTGRLRESLSSLKRADAIILAAEALSGKLPGFVRDKTHVLERSIVIQNAPQRPIAFCGIAKPAQFFADLKSAGVQLSAEIAFRDHHRYTERDVDLLLAKRKSSRADGFVTTEKDRINLGVLASRLAPLAVAELRLRLQDENKLTQSLVRVLE